ncbi:hypothetical protein [Anaeromicropila populeti]|uniref:Uncharacterized protein n=1 Tax=Anaeromicropila populeti TaxID=37658 RepID=A0A1I6IT21_9FIRM|nr:hypothetical protein [Anaeromicropila populeti]SFR69863.1 hypothetical protein SAMN05661086_01151 [Anaeromicropila populeti]
MDIALEKKGELEAESKEKVSWVNPKETPVQAKFGSRSFTKKNQENIFSGLYGDTPVVQRMEIKVKNDKGEDKTAKIDNLFIFMNLMGLLFDEDKKEHPNRKKIKEVEQIEKFQALYEAIKERAKEIPPKIQKEIDFKEFTLDNQVEIMQSVAELEIPQDKNEVLLKIYTTLEKENLLDDCIHTQWDATSETKDLYEKYNYITFFAFLLAKEKHSDIKLPAVLDIFKARKYHYNLEREKKGFTGNEEEDIDPTDIKKEYVKNTSCVITALFHAESALGAAPFGSSSPEELHGMMVTFFSDNKFQKDGYKKEENHNQFHNVWKNYSDDSVNPSLYKYFKYKEVAGASCIGKHLDKLKERGRNAADQGIYDDLVGKLGGVTSGIILTAGHAMFFQKGENGFLLKDNDNGGNSEGIYGENGGKAIKSIWKR